MRRIVSSAVIAIAMLPDRAGADSCIEGDAQASMRMIERFAKDRSARQLLSSGSSIWICAGEQAAKLKARVVAACTAILDRDGDESPCVGLVATAGVAKLGDHDIFATVATYEADPLQSSGTYDKYSTFEMLRAMGDPRALALIVDRWKATIPRIEELEKLPKRSTKRSNAIGAWAGWRQGAAQVLGALGGDTEKVFLEEQAAATKDQYVRAACKAAAAAITKRSKAAP